jgi:hypothetical protein
LLPAAPPEPVAGAASPDVAGEELSAGAGLGDAVSPAAGLGPLPLKSVAYQPVPLSWNPAAVICLLNVAALHAGHTVNSGSEIF